MSPLSWRKSAARSSCADGTSKSPPAFPTPLLLRLARHRRGALSGRSRCYGDAFAHTITSGLVGAPLGQVTVLSLTSVTGLLRGPQYATTSTSFWSHSARHAAVSQLERLTRTAPSAGDAVAFAPGGPSAPAGPGSPGGPAGPARPGSPFSPAGPTGPGSPLGPVVPSPQPATQIKTAIAIAVLLMCMHAPSGLPVTIGSR